MAERAVLRSKGQVTLPTAIRRRAGFEEGDLLEFEVVEGRVVITTLKAIDPEKAWFWTEEEQARHREAAEEIAAGRTTLGETLEDFFAWLNRPID